MDDREWQFPELGVQCPLPGAHSASLRVFRVVTCIPPIRADFLSMAEEQGSAFRGGNPSRVCRGHGLSVMRSIEDAISLKKRASGYKAIAVGNLSEDHGVVLDTPSDAHQSHVTWWPYREVAPEVLFEITEVTTNGGH